MPLAKQVILFVIDGCSPDYLRQADTVFGTLETTGERVDLRSHGSLHEQLVPLIGYGGASRNDWIAENKDAIVWIEGEWTTAPGS